MNIDDVMKGYMREKTCMSLIETTGLLWVGDPLRLCRDVFGSTMLYKNLATGDAMRAYCGGQLFRVPRLMPDSKDRDNYLKHRKMPIRTTWHGDTCFRAAFELTELDERCRVGERDREEMDLYLTQRQSGADHTRQLRRLTDGQQ
jgi:hypothetical protein